MITANTHKGVFDTMAPDMVRVPLRTRILVSTANLTASEVGEASAKPVRRLTVTNLDTETGKHCSLIAISAEFAQMAPALAQGLLANALVEAVSRSVDTAFLAKLATVDSGLGIQTSNPTFADMMADIEEALRLIDVGERSRLYGILSPRSMKAFAVQAAVAGVPSLTYRGGEILGIRWVASDGASDDVLILADASAIAYGDDGIEVRTSTQCALELKDDPTGDADAPTAVQLTDCFSTNTLAIAAERRIAVRVFDTDGVASLQGLTWGLGAGSPAGA